MRKWMIVFLMVLLVGCNVSAESLSDRIEVSINNSIEAKPATIVNHTTKLYQFYLPFHMGKKASNSTSVLLQSNDVDIVMSIDAANIIMQRFYRTSLNSNQLREIPTYAKVVFDQSGQYLSSNQVTLNYRLIVSQVDEYLYSIVLQSDAILLSAITPLALVETIVFDMMTVAKSTKVNRETVVSMYSNKQIINYQRQTLELFEQIAPESGRVADMISIVEGNMNFNQDFFDDYFNDLEPEEPTDDIQ